MHFKVLVRSCGRIENSMNHLLSGRPTRGFIVPDSWLFTRMGSSIVCQSGDSYDGVPDVRFPIVSLRWEVHQTWRVPTTKIMKTCSRST